MPGLAETLKELTSRTMAGLNAASSGSGLPTQGLPSQGQSSQGRLTQVSFAPDPGRLRMWQYRPAGLPRGAPLVVALHGCGQTAVGYDHGTGWSQLADRLGFALLFPEQVSGNNAQTCFNWFEPADTSRGSGEVASVAAMVAHMMAAGDLDRSRVFVTGLSAGGAMTAALLACYPDVFAAGAVIAGLPVGTAASMNTALDAMFRGHTETGATWAGRVRAVGPSGHRGPWPRVAIWHGGADHTVKPVNAGEAVKQWLDVHGLDGAGRTEMLDGASRTVWRDASGRAVVEQVGVPGLGHGVPIAPGVSGIGSPGQYFLSCGVSSTEEIARFFGLQPATAAPQADPGAPNDGPRDPAPHGQTPHDHVLGDQGMVGRLLRGLDPLKLMNRTLR